MFSRTSAQRCRLGAAAVDDVRAVDDRLAQAELVLTPAQLPTVEPVDLSLLIRLNGSDNQEAAQTNDSR